MRVGGNGTPFSVPARCRPRGVELDPDYKILRWTDDLRLQTAALSGPMKGWVLGQMGKDAEAEQVLAKLVAEQAANDNYDRALMANASLARLTDKRGCPACAISHIQNALSLSPVRRERLASTYLSLATLAQRLDQHGLAARAATAARDADSRVGGANGADSKLRQLGL